MAKPTTKAIAETYPEKIGRPAEIVVRKYQKRKEGSEK
jgi:hypothetical protein